MNGKQHTGAGRQGPENRRLPLFLSVTRRTIPVLASLFLLSGCATMTDLADRIPDWIPEWTGGEGKMAQSVRPRVVEAAPVPEPAPVPAGPSREEIKAVQSDLAELGYNPGSVDGNLGWRTKRAIRAFQKDTGMEADGMITQELADSLAATPRPEKPPVLDTAALPEIDPKIEFGSRRDVLPVQVIHVENANILPLYDAGDAYVWSNGQVETVVRVAGNKLFWRTSSGQRYTADRNFLIPPSSWAGPSGSGEADARLEGRTSWPLQAESPLEFEVAGDGSLEKWRCRTAGTRRVTVPAGQFEVVALACERNSGPVGEWVRRVWLYAPEVRHYVARTDIMADGSRDSIELVGVRPGAEDWPPAARAGLDRAIQDALGELLEGESSQWSSTFVKEEFEILPGPTHDTGDDGRCRNFELTARSAGISRIYPARACISGNNNKWRIPNDTGSGSGGASFLTSAS
ncbi:MAG: peptidoglycan-binding protein [Proteobacteria bacterium]|nr:peptidoglycan-binding protein [Pseudomonadota bacterium]